MFFLDLRACIYKKNKLNLIKEQHHAVHDVVRSFQRKNKFYILSHLGQTTFGYAITKAINREKAKTIFRSRFFRNFTHFLLDLEKIIANCRTFLKCA